MNKIKFGIIGAGHIGKRHAEMIERNEDSQLVAMCDVRSKEDCLVPYDVPFFNDVDQMLKEGPAMDAVCVCTPNGLHAAHSLAVLQTQRHLVIEKPMALTRADCEKIIYTALNVHRQIFCVMQNRYSPPSEWIKSVIGGGILGSIFLVSINCYWNRDARYYKKPNWKGYKELDGGTLFTQFSHFIDIMYWLFGDITNIQSRFRDFNHKLLTEFEDTGIVSFDFVNGGIGNINFSTSIRQTNFESSMTIIGENGTVKIGGQYLNEVEYCNIADYTMPKLKAANPANDYGDYKGSAANHVYIIENVINTLKGQTNITTNALEGLKVVDIIERIYQSSPRVEKMLLEASPRYGVA
ncbi:MAG: Gfo/Idh/MocA family oxidoreductase [Flavobacteriales bacterium]|nr:Gfo/Idh/MocA family oxidoreductase [Flavobacteriales bacterium]